jgi:hypothetical protein
VGAYAPRICVIWRGYPNPEGDTKPRQIAFCGLGWKNEKEETKMGKKIIFLDVDGVLNYASFEGRSPDGFMGVDDKKIKLLRQIVEATGASIVLSSSWKIGWNRDMPHDTDVEYLVSHLANEGLKIIDKTGNELSHERGKEIRGWLDKHQDVEAWAVLDDVVFADFADCGILPHLIKTSFCKRGLQEKHVRACIKLLNNERTERE